MWYILNMIKQTAPAFLLGITREKTKEVNMWREIC